MFWFSEAGGAKALPLIPTARENPGTVCCLRCIVVVAPCAVIAPKTRSRDPALRTGCIRTRARAFLAIGRLRGEFGALPTAGTRSVGSALDETNDNGSKLDTLLLLGAETRLSASVPVNRLSAESLPNLESIPFSFGFTIESRSAAVSLRGQKRRFTMLLFLIGEATTLALGLFDFILRFTDEIPL